MGRTGLPGRNRETPNLKEAAEVRPPGPGLGWARSGAAQREGGGRGGRGGNHFRPIRGLRTIPQKSKHSHKCLLGGRVSLS